MQDPKKIESLLERRGKVKARLEKVNQKMQKEKENEEAWPGHGGSSDQLLEEEFEILEAHLIGIEKGIRNLKKVEGR